VAAVVSSDDLSRLIDLERGMEQRLEAALSRMRAAFAGVSEEQLTRDFTAIIDRGRSKPEIPTSSKTA